MSTASPIAVQRPLLSVEQTRALVSLDVVKTELVDYTEDDILKFAGMYDLGLPVLGPVWNIATKDARRAERRWLMSCVRQFKTGQRSVKLSLAESVALILPHRKVFLEGTELQQAFNCGSTHIINLIREDSLRIMPGTEYRPGRGGSPAITRESVIKFLTVRQEI